MVNTISKISTQLEIIAKVRVSYSQINDKWDDEICRAFDKTVSLISHCDVEQDYEERIRKARITDELDTTMRADYEVAEVNALLEEMAEETTQSHEFDALMMVAEFMDDYYDAQ